MLYESPHRRAAELETYRRQNYPAAAMSEVAEAAKQIRFKSDLKARLLPQIAERLHAPAPMQRE